MLPPGKYVVEVIMPPGYEVYKEEDKNLLIGDNYIAPVTQQFAGLGRRHLHPPRPGLGGFHVRPTSGVGYNATNYQNATTGLRIERSTLRRPGLPRLSRILCGRAWVRCAWCPTT